jgi:hypothetical protein
MAAKSASSQSTKRNVSAPETVETFLEALQHPFKPEILALRQIILEADPSIAEAIKWNAPSFRTSEYFATMHLRAKAGVQLILHLGAKVRGDTAAGLAIADPEALLTWLGKDRASATFHDLDQIQARRSAFTNIIRQWITYV